MSDTRNPVNNLLRDRSFVLYWLGRAISLLGTAITSVVLPILCTNDCLGWHTVWCGNRRATGSMDFDSYCLSDNGNRCDTEYRSGMVLTFTGAEDGARASASRIGNRRFKASPRLAEYLYSFRSWNLHDLPLV